MQFITEVAGFIALLMILSGIFMDTDLLWPGIILGGISSCVGYFFWKNAHRHY